MHNIYSFASLLSFTAGAREGMEKEKLKNKWALVQERRPLEPRSAASWPRWDPPAAEDVLTPPTEPSRPHPPASTFFSFFTVCFLTPPL